MFRSLSKKGLIKSIEYTAAAGEASISFSFSLYVGIPKSDIGSCRNCELNPKLYSVQKCAQLFLNLELPKFQKHMGF